MHLSHTISTRHLGVELFGLCVDLNQITAYNATKMDRNADADRNQNNNFTFIQKPKAPTKMLS